MCLAVIDKLDIINNRKSRQLYIFMNYVERMFGRLAYQVAYWNVDNVTIKY